MHEDSIMWHHVMWHHATSCDVLWHLVTSCDVLWCLVTSCDIVMSCDSLWHHVMSCDVTSCDVLWHHVMSYDIMWCLVASCDIIIMIYGQTGITTIKPLYTETHPSSHEVHSWALIWACDNSINILNWNWCSIDCRILVVCTKWRFARLVSIDFKLLFTSQHTHCGIKTRDSREVTEP